MSKTMENWTFIKNALKKATPEQLVKIRGIIVKHQVESDKSSAWIYPYALTAFDKGQYDDADIADVLNEAEVTEAMK